MISEFHYFPSAVYRDEKPEWVDHVLRQADRYYVEQTKVNKENNITWPVIQTGHMGNDPELFFLADYFAKTSADLLAQQGYYLDGHEFYTSGMWGQEIACNGLHEPHIHPNAQMCGLFFLDTPEGGSFPMFSDPRPGKLMTDLPIPGGDVLVSTSKILFNNMVPGTFLFFNAWLPHQFTSNQSQTPTKFIHFILGCREKLI